MTGNYSSESMPTLSRFIISYQVMTGNYSWRELGLTPSSIISYQVMTGNYSCFAVEGFQ